MMFQRFANIPASQKKNVFFLDERKRKKKTHTHAAGSPHRYYTIVQ